MLHAQPSLATYIRAHKSKVYAIAEKLFQSFFNKNFSELRDGDPLAVGLLLLLMELHMHLKHAVLILGRQRVLIHAFGETHTLLELPVGREECVVMVLVIIVLLLVLGLAGDDQEVSTSLG